VAAGPDERTLVAIAAQAAAHAAAQAAAPAADAATQLMGVAAVGVASGPAVRHDDAPPL